MELQGPRSELAAGRKLLRTSALKRPPQLWLIAAFGLALLLIVPLLSYTMNFLNSTPGRRGSVMPKPAQVGRMLKAAPAYYEQILGTGLQVPRLQLDIKYKHWEKLTAKRAEALAARFLHTGPDDLVPARLTADDQEVKVKVRLKGDNADHLRGKRWSMRIKVRDPDSVFGMRRFSVQAPYTRSNQLEPLVTEHFRQLGLLAPRFFYGDLTVNGQRIGLMAVQEHFSKELLESHQRRESAILTFNEDWFFKSYSLLGTFDGGEFSNWRNTPLTVMQEGRVARSPELSRRYATAAGLVRGVNEGAIAPSDAFDPEIWGTTLAACEIWSANHIGFFMNFRFYLNPVTVKLEPILNEVFLNTRPEEPAFETLECLGDHFEFMDTLFADPRIRAAFFRAMDRIGKDVLSPEFQSRIRQRESELLKVLRLEYPHLETFDLDRVVLRAEKLLELNEENYQQYLKPRPDRNKRHSAELAYPTAVFAYLVQDGRRHYLELVNALPHPVEVTALQLVSEEGAEKPLEGVARFKLPIRLEPSRWPEVPERIRMDIEDADNLAAGWSIAGTAHAVGSTRDLPFVSIQGHPARSTPGVPVATLEQTLRDHPFLSPDPGETGWLVARPGTWQVQGSLILPETMGLRVGPGTTLRFEPEAVLVARGPLAFEGTVDEPVVLEAQETSWQGLAVIESSQAHSWKHVIVRATSGIQRPEWSLTGGVTFRKGEVSLTDTLFDGTTAEDALNLIRSSFSMRDTSFAQTSSDAFDCDFCTGSIIGGSMVDIGGDGVDVSGSEIDVVGMHFARVHDKAVSVGERSRLSASGLHIEHCGAGLASKDASHAEIADSTMEEIRHVALMAYAKKSEFGPATLLAQRMNISMNSDAAMGEAIAQSESRLSVDGALLPTRPVDVDKLYASGFMKKE